MSHGGGWGSSQALLWMLQQGLYEDPDSAFLLCLAFMRVALPVAGEKSRVDTDSWISDS